MLLTPFPIPQHELVPDTHPLADPAGRGCWVREAGAAGPGRWVTEEDARRAWDDGMEVWWPLSSGWALTRHCSNDPNAVVSPQNEQPILLGSIIDRQGFLSVRDELQRVIHRAIPRLAEGITVFHDHNKWNQFITGAYGRYAPPYELGSWVERLLGGLTRLTVTYIIAHSTQNTTRYWLDEVFDVAWRGGDEPTFEDWLSMPFFCPAVKAALPDLKGISLSALVWEELSNSGLIEMIMASGSSVCAGMPIQQSSSILTCLQRRLWNSDMRPQMLKLICQWSHIHIPNRPIAQNAPWEELYWQENVTALLVKEEVWIELKGICPDIANTIDTLVRANRRLLLELAYQGASHELSCRYESEILEVYRRILEEHGFNPLPYGVGLSALRTERLSPRFWQLWIGFVQQAIEQDRYIDLEYRGGRSPGWPIPYGDALGAPPYHCRESLELANFRRTCMETWVNLLLPRLRQECKSAATNSTSRRVLTACDQFLDRIRNAEQGRVFSDSTRRKIRGLVVEVENNAKSNTRFFEIWERLKEMLS